MGSTGDDGADADGEDTGESDAEVSWCWLRKQGDTSIDEEHANASENNTDAESDNVSTASSSSDDEEDQIKWFDKTNTIEERGSICSSNTSRRGGRGIQLQAAQKKTSSTHVFRLWLQWQS